MTVPGTLAQVTTADHQTAVEAPKERRAEYGGADTK